MFKQITGLFLSSLLLVSCNQQTSSTVGADGYSFGTKQYEKTQVQVNVVTYESRADLLKVARSRGINSDSLVAFTILRPPFDTCTIHMVDPSVLYEPEFVGHEFLHCVYGQWHTDNDSRS